MAFFIAPVLGINTKYFEMGGSVSFGYTPMRRRQQGASFLCERDCFLFFCSGLRYEENLSFDETSKFYAPFVTVGIYGSAYYSRFSLNYSGYLNYPKNVFGKEDVSSNDESEYYVDTDENRFSAVFTNRYSVGYSLTKMVGIRLGAIQIFGDFEGQHWLGFGGIELSF